MAKPIKHGGKHETVRFLTYTGIYTGYVTIPKAYLNQLKWESGQPLNVSMIGSKIVIEKSRRKIVKKKAA